MKAYRGKPQPPQLTDTGKALATKARQLMQAMERGDMARFTELAEQTPELAAIFAENDEQTALSIIAMLLDLGHDERLGPSLHSETARPGSWLVDVDRNYARVKRGCN
jgi:hypothetical protein